jgi:hypothetical protein
MARAEVRDIAAFDEDSITLIKARISTDSGMKKRLCFPDKNEKKGMQIKRSIILFLRV